MDVDGCRKLQNLFDKKSGGHMLTSWTSYRQRNVGKWQFGMYLQEVRRLTSPTWAQHEHAGTIFGYMGYNMIYFVLRAPCPCRNALAGGMAWLEDGPSGLTGCTDYS